jgi:hypothetical protein
LIVNSAYSSWEFVPDLDVQSRNVYDWDDPDTPPKINNDKNRYLSMLE